MSTKVASNDEEYDIYSDLPNFQVTESITKLESKTKYLLEEKRKLSNTIEELQQIVDIFRKQKAELESKNKRLSLNMCSLYKTAATEIRRKDRMIEEMRREHDNVVFRRRRYKSSERYERHEQRHERRHSVPSSVDWNETADDAETTEKLKILNINKNNSESNYTTQNGYSKVASDTVIASTNKHASLYTGPASEYSKRMFAKLREQRYKQCHSVPASVNWNGTADDGNEETTEELEVLTKNEKNSESNYTTQSEYNEVASESVIASTNKNIPVYTGPATEYSKRMFAKLHGISVDEIICKMNKPDNCIKERKNKESIHNKSKQYTETQKCNDLCTDNLCNTERETNATNTSKSVTATVTKTPVAVKLKTPKIDRRCLREKLHPTDLIKLGAQKLVRSEEKKSIQENVSNETSVKHIMTFARKSVNNQAKDETIQNNDSKVVSPTTANTGTFKLDTGQVCEPHESSEHSKQDQNRIKQLLHDSHKFLTKAKTVCSNKLKITPTSGYSESITTVSQEEVSSADTEKLKSVTNRSPTVSTKPSVVNSNRKSRQAQLLASLFNSPEPNKLKNDSDSNVTTSKTAKPTVQPNISSTVKNNKLGKTPPKVQPYNKSADTTPKRQTTVSADREANIPGDIISPILAKISENVCMLPLLKDKIANQRVLADIKKCPRTAAEKLIHNVTDNSCSIMGEDTLGMVTSLARPRQTVSPIKTPDKEGNMNKTPQTIVQKHLQGENTPPTNFSTVNKHSLLRKGTEIKSSYLPSLSLVNKNQVKKHGVSVCLSSEHGEFKRKRSVRTPVTSETDDGSPEKRRRLEDYGNFEKQIGDSSKVRNVSSAKKNKKINYVYNVQGNERNRWADETIDLKTASSKVENNSGKENNEETETLRKHNFKSPGHRGRGSHSRRQSSRRLRYSPYRHRRRSPLRSFERNMHRRSPVYLRHSDKRRSHRSRSVTPLRHRSCRSRSYSPVRLRSKRSVSLSPPKQLKEKYLKHSKVCCNTKTREKIENKFPGDDFSEEFVDKNELENTGGRNEINHKQEMELKKSESSVKYNDVEKSEVIDRSGIQVTNVDKICTLAVNTKSPLSKAVKTNMTSICNNSLVQKSGSEINVTANKTQKVCTDLKNNVVTTPVLKVADISPSVVIIKRRSRKVVRLEDNEMVSAVQIKSPKKSNEIKLLVDSETKEHTAMGVRNSNFCVTQEQKETVTTKNVNLDHKNVYDDRIVKNKDMENKVSSEIVQSNKELPVTPEQKKNTCTEVNIHDSKTMKNSNMSENTVSSGNNKTTDVGHEEKGNDFILTTENIKKLNSCFNSSSKKPLQTAIKKHLYMALFGTPDSKCSSDSSETEDGEIASSSDEGEKN